jgi:hypothetical protein
MKGIKAYIADFEKCCKKHKKYGAGDTEPDTVFQILIDRASRGMQPEIPRTPGGWELLHGSDPDCSRAAGELHNAAWNVVDAIETCPVREINDLRDVIRDYCWRLG